MSVPGGTRVYRVQPVAGFRDAAYYCDRERSLLHPAFADWSYCLRCKQ